MSSTPRKIYVVATDTPDATNLFDQYFDTIPQAISAINGLISQLQREHPELTYVKQTDTYTYAVGVPHQEDDQFEYFFIIEELSSFADQLIADRIIGKSGYI